MLSNVLSLLKAMTYAAAFSSIVYCSYDYGVKSTEAKALNAQNALWDKVEKKQNEAFQLAVKLANQKPDIRIQFREIEKKVIKYVQSHTDKQCVVNDDEWLHIRAESVRAHNRAIGIQQPASLINGSSSATASYKRDAEVLAENVANIQTYAENAQQLLTLQTWIAAQFQ